MCTSEQLTLAKASSLLAEIIARDPLGRPLKVILPGHGGKRYRVILRWKDGGEGTVSAECAEYTPLGYVPCKSGDRICYHKLGAFMAAFRDRGYRLAITTETGILRLRNVGGSVVRLRVWKSEHEVWGLAKRVRELERVA